MASTLNLLDLPSSVLIDIMCSVPAAGLAKLSQVHSILNTVVKDEEVWIARAKQDYNIVLKKSEWFSPREFYQLVLHTYGTLQGLWKRINHLYYGGLLRVLYDDHAIVIEMLEAPHDVTHELIRRKMVTISKAKQEAAVQIENHDELTPGLLAQINVASSNAFQIEFDVENEDPVAMASLMVSLLHKWMKQPYVVQDLHGEKFILHGEKFTSMFSNRDVYTCDRLILESSQKNLPIEPGLFKGSYGAHGNELINLSFIFAEEGGLKGVEGIKICGDPNVPASQVTFVIEENLCTVVRMEDGELVFDTNQLVEYKDDMAMHFCIPESYDVEPSLTDFKICKGYWRCKCQVADTNFTNPTMLQGYFIIFSNDVFAVMVLDLQGICVYHRAEDL